MKDLLLDAQELMLKWQAGAPPRKQKWWMGRPCLMKVGQSQGGPFVKLCSKHNLLFQRTPHAVGVWRRLLWSGVMSVQLPDIFAVTVTRLYTDRGHFMTVMPWLMVTICQFHQQHPRAVMANVSLLVIIIKILYLPGISFQHVVMSQVLNVTIQ